MSMKKSFDDLLKSLAEAKQIGIEKVLAFYRAKTVPEMKTSTLDLDDETLDWLCEELAMESEDYEICQAVLEIKSERSANNAVPIIEEEEEDEDELLEEAKRQKKITSKQHSGAMLKMLNTNNSAFDKYFEIRDNPESTKEEIDTAAKDATKIVGESRRKFDEIDKIFKDQKKK